MDVRRRNGREREIEGGLEGRGKGTREQQKAKERESESAMFEG